MGVKIVDSNWLGFKARSLENEAIRIVVVPSSGAKIVSLFDRRTQREWLIGPGERPFQEVPYGAVFVDQDMSGWDEMFPTIVTCKYPVAGSHLGVTLPDHGEVWPLAWEEEQAAGDALQFSVEGVALRYRLTRTLRFSGPQTVQMAYELQNLEQEPLAYLWSAHPQFLCRGGASICLPSQVSEVCNVLGAEWGWGEPETRFAWPEAIGVDGQPVRIDRVGPAAREQIRKFFVPPEAPAGWAGLVREEQDEWLLLEWDAQEIPYLGIWIDEGLISHETVVALEPMTGYYDSLATAWKKQRVTVIEPGARQSWSLSVSIGCGERPLAAVDQAG